MYFPSINDYYNYRLNEQESSIEKHIYVEEIRLKKIVDDKMSEICRNMDNYFNEFKISIDKTMMKLNDQREMLDDFANKQTQTIQNIIINEEYNIDIILNKHIKKCISRVNKQRIEIEENINDMDKHIKSEFNDVVSEIKTKMFLNVKQLMDSPDYKCILENALNSRIIHIEEYSINNRDNCVNKPCYIKNTNQHLVISMCNNIDDVIKSKSREKKWAIRKKYEKRIKKCETEFNDYKSSVKLELNTIGYAREKYKKKNKVVKGNN